MRNEKKEVRTTLWKGPFSGSIIDREKLEDDTVGEVVAWLQWLLGQVPPEHRDRAFVSFESESVTESYQNEIEVYYVRPETDEEVARRLEKEKRREEMEREHERMLYQSLKKKYEGTDA